MIQLWLLALLKNLNKSKKIMHPSHKVVNNRVEVAFTQHLLKTKIRRNYLNKKIIKIISMKNKEA